MSAADLKTGTIIQRIVNGKEKWPGAVLSLSTSDDKVVADIEWFDGTKTSSIVLAGLPCTLIHDGQAHAQHTGTRTTQESISLPPLSHIIC